ncbi:sodium ion-translocating decarboxylase subunit beta [Desulfoscipio geothermicus]|uniref:sodium ion-translocating decarboxylase subunit beta n=1 Tax=Desulfoscipio geothermicus TaxID=39060 RepID=UPI000B8144AB|nr:sodium ion-translocating decarboxylase subunit beta [Desulfoscipio geothermicus]
MSTTPVITTSPSSTADTFLRLVHIMGAEENPQNYLLMHAMGPNVAGVIGTAVYAGALISSLG